MIITPEAAAGLIEKSNNITVFTGAGISTSCGIPDFRGANGLYSIVKSKYDLPTPESIFDIDYFKINPAPFYDFSKALFDDTPSPSFTHYFLAGLEKMGKINLIVTQNIDMLHEKAGSKKIVNFRGSCKNHDYIIFAFAITQYNCVLSNFLQKLEMNKVFLQEALPWYIYECNLYLLRGKI